MKRLRDRGKPRSVVEHDGDTMRAADYHSDIGPGAGARGGQVMAAGTPEENANNPQVISAYLGSDDDTDSDDAKHESEEA